MPIGDIFPHLDYVLLDDALRPCDDGELCLRGPQRFPGYLDPSENAGRFVTFEGSTEGTEGTEGTDGTDGTAGTMYDGSDPLTADGEPSSDDCPGQALTVKAMPFGNNREALGAHSLPVLDVRRLVHHLGRPACSWSAANNHICYMVRFHQTVSVSVVR